MNTLPDLSPAMSALPPGRLGRLRLFRELSRPLEPLDAGVPPCPAVAADVVPRAVFFDVYGTMVLSAAGEIAKDAGVVDDSMDPVRAALAAEGVDAPGASWPRMLDIIRASHAVSRGRGVDFPEVDILAVWRELTGGRLDDDALARLAIRCEAAANPCWPEPTLAQTLARLKARNIPVGIVSNAQFYTRDMLEAFLGMPLNEAGIDPRLEVWSHSEGFAKPSRALYGTAAARLDQAHGIAPCDALMVGNDMRNDIAPAQAEGFRGVLYAGDRRSLRLRLGDPALAGVAPFATITRLDQTPCAPRGLGLRI